MHSVVDTPAEVREDQAVLRPSSSTPRLRCAGRGCQHSRSSHDEAGFCAWCAGTGRCRGWAETRPHLWRQRCWDIWYSAWTAWEWQRDNICKGYRTEEREYPVPQPTFKETLVGLANTQG